MTTLQRFILGVALVATIGCAERQDVRVPMPEGADRIWLGPDFYANRLQDWHISGGIIRSVEGRASKPMRTAHLLTRALVEGPGMFRASLLVHGRPDSADTGTWAGLLLGAGNADIDYRISVLTHHWPAREGGLIVAVDGAGRLVLRDNGTQGERTGPGARYTEADWPLLGALTAASVLPDPVRLEVQIGAEKPGTLTARLVDPNTGEVLGAGELRDLPDRFLQGTVALVSHGSPASDGAGYGFSDWTLGGDKLRSHPERMFGPVLGVMYTISGNTLKLSAQFGPLGASDDSRAALEISVEDRWRRAAEATIEPSSGVATFRVQTRDASQPAAYRVLYELDGDEYLFEGLLRGEPTGTFVLAGLNCHHISGGDGSWTPEHFWYPHAELTASVARQDPDLLFFAGDQIYESGLEGIVRAPTDTAILDYLNHWNRFLLAFGSLTRDRPTVAIPDDHDVYHGNIWGEGGKAATGPHQPASDNGGYIMPPEFVNVVHRTQTAHLPDPVDPRPIGQDISVYFTSLDWGGLSFAVLADRMWKSAPRDRIPAARIWNGWSQDRSFDAATEADLPGLELLGARQEAFLDEWADDWRGGTWMKVLLSQTPFVNVATIPEDAMSGAVIPGLPNPAPGEYPEGYRKAADFDSGGWPQTPRNRAVRSLRRSFALHIAGDQHLGSVVRYGVDEFGDGGFAYTLPSIANIWPRRWFPPEPGGNRREGSPRYTGDHLDGFGNRMTVHAVANPVDSGKLPSALYDRVPGYGIVRFEPADRSITIEAWPRWEDAASPGARQYAGWPIRMNQQDGYGRFRAGYLPSVPVDGAMQPVVRVDDETTGEWLYTIRSAGTTFRPWVFDASHAYAVTVRPGDAGDEVRYSGLHVTADSAATVSGR